MLALEKDKLGFGFKNKYSRYSYERHTKSRKMIQRVKNKKAKSKMAKEGQIEIKSDYDTFVSLKLSKSSINFDVFEKIEKEILPVKETKASMGRKKRITQFF